MSSEPEEIDISGLDEFTTEQLRTALLTRTSSAVMIYIIPDDNSTHNAAIIAKGSGLQILGLLKFADHHVLNNLKSFRGED